MNIRGKWTFGSLIGRFHYERAKATPSVAGRARSALTLLALLLVALGCSSKGEEESVGEATEAVVSSASLELKVLTNSCGANQVQDFFQIKNTGTTSVAVSDLSVKLWINDTSSSALSASISTGGCLSNASGCFHQVTGTTAAATPFSPACGPDASHQANREITLTTADHTLLAPGQTWMNLQSALRLANGANFSPGTGTWYSSCLTGTQYKTDSHYALYYKGSLVFSSGLTPPICRSPQGKQKLTGYVPTEMSSAQLVGPLAQSTVVHFGVGLPVRNAAALDTFVQQVSDPNSPNYRAYLTPDQFTATYGPTQADFQAVVNWATANGLTVDNASSSSRLLVNVHGTAASVEKALYANLVQRKRADNTLFYMLDREPSLDLDTTVLRVSGLDNFRLSEHALTNIGSGQNSWFIGADFRKAYADCTSGRGSGQRVGIIGSDGFHASDIASYAVADGLSSPPPVTPVLLDGFDGTPSGDDGEMELDIEMAMAMAPGLDEIVVFEAPPSESATQAVNSLFDQATSRMPLANQLSTSFIFDIDKTTQQYYNKAVAQGQSIFQPSGDNGGNSSSYTSTAKTNTFSLWGATLVGATVLQPGGEIALTFSGGGPLQATPIPPYQLGLDVSLNGGSTIYRNAPDVSMNAWGVEHHYGGGTVQSAFGTSVSTPLWAGFMALINEQAQKNGNPPLGFLNPVVWAIGLSDLYEKTFNDIQEGANNAFNAVTGYDLVTGWGSPKCELITQLAGSNPLAPARIGLKGGYQNYCVLAIDGSVKCWGDNNSHQLGAGDSIWSTPATVDVGGPVADVGLGYFHSCWALQSGKVMCMGRNLHGQLGNGTTDDSSTPVEVSGITDAISVCAGWSHSCALRANGTVKCWGEGTGGGLGNGTTEQSTTPVDVVGLEGAFAISCGQFETCALTGSNAQCWGANIGAKLGDGNLEADEQYRATAAPVAGFTTMRSLSVAQTSACMIATQGGLLCWGEEDFAEFGVSATAKAHPGAVSPDGLPFLRQVSAQDTNVCVTTATGTVMCAGASSGAMLGYETDVEHAFFSQEVPGLSNVAEVRVGGETVCARTSGGSVYCWGLNDLGRFGSTSVPVGTKTFTPVQLTF